MTTATGTAGTPGAGGAGGAVAITGMACLFPGAPDLDAYWANILHKVDATSAPPPESWDPEVYYDPTFADTDRTYCQRGGYLGALATFDPLAHGIPPVAVGGEPDQWLALRVASDALADAGASALEPAIRARTAVILGKGTYLNGGNAIAVQRGLVVGQTIDLLRRLHPEYTEGELERLRGELQATLPPLSPDTVPGLIPNIIVGRIANRLDLMGPAYTVDAACASSLVAVGHAVRDLQSGECDLALAGGSQVWMPVATLNLFSRLGALSRGQQLRAFDRDADGTLLGEGIGIVVLKRLADAVRDGDRVYAVVRGVGVASDGRGLSVMAPRIEGEELALRRAYDAAGVSPRTVGLVEAHGTGTPVGDVTEVRALTRVFGEREGELAPCALGTVKSMISHTIPAAGVAGMIKVALALHHRVLPPTLNCDEPNPELELERTPFYINADTRPWIHGGAEPRRAGINAFGFGGINAHAVLEEFEGAPTGDHRPRWDTELCLLEASGAQSVAREAQRLADALDAAPEMALTDLAFTLAQAVGEVEAPRRLAIVASSVADLRHKLEQAIIKLGDPATRRIKAVNGVHYESEPLGRDGKVVLVFPGEGAQYPHMLADLCLHFPAARAVFDRIDRLYRDHPRGHVLSDWVFPRAPFTEADRRRPQERLMELDIAVESVLTANAAVHAVVGPLLRRVDAMLGHSTGEHSAAMAAGVLDLDADERLGLFCHGLHDSYADALARLAVPRAALLAIGADAAYARRLAEAAGGELYLAMDNCPHQVVLVGDPEAAARARELAAAEGVMCEQLPYDRAVHTPQFAPIADDLRGVFARLPVRATEAGLWSCTTAAPYPQDAAAIRELLVEHWTSPVRFRETIEALHDDGARVFVETGPRGNLTAFIADILRGRPVCAVAADSQRRSGVTQLNHAVAMLAVHDVPLDLAALFAGRGARTVDWRNPAPAPVRRPEMALSTAWPMMRLSAEAVARVRPAVPPPAPAAPPPPLAAPPPPFAAPLAAPPVPAAPALPAAGDDAAADALTAHLETMERFLTTGAEILHAYLGTAPGPEAADDGWPLVGTLVSHVPHTELIARRTIDLHSDPYLRDHTLGREVSRHDPGLTALAVVPLAMSLEILAQAAWRLLPDAVVTGLRDVRAHRWLAAGERPLTVEVTARRLTDTDTDTDTAGRALVHVELCTAGDPAPAVTGTVVLAAGHDPAPAATPVAPGDGSPSRWAPGHLYDEAMFHGPRWQGVEIIDAVGAGAILADLRVPPRSALLAATSAPRFALDPVILDAAGQLVGFWAAQRLDRGHVVFPFRMAALDVFGPPAPEGERLRGAARIALEGEYLVRSDIEVVDAAGHCRLRICGWEDKRFDVPGRFAALAAPGRPAALSEPWPAPVPPGTPLPVSCRRLTADLGADAALWEEVWSSRLLGRRERQLLASLTYPPARRREWLAARTAAKEAVAELLADRHGLDVVPADIEILPDAHGRPTVVCAEAEAVGVTPLVSLSHSAGVGVAIAALAPAGAPAGIGIDVEHLQERPDGFAAAALGPDELALLPAEGHDEWVLRGWCAKEAAAKAVGSGLSPGRRPRLRHLHLDRQELTLEAAGSPLVVTTTRQGALVTATVICPPVTPGAIPGVDGHIILEGATAR